MRNVTKKNQRKAWEKIAARRGTKGSSQSSRTASKLGGVRKPSKYHAVPTMAHGIRFDSKKEAWRYAELLVLAKAGMIEDLRLQVPYALYVANVTTGATDRIGEYVADFTYSDYTQVVVEDVKGFKTPLYQWKKKHVEAQYGIVIREL